MQQLAGPPGLRARLRASGPHTKEDPPCLTRLWDPPDHGPTWLLPPPDHGPTWLWAPPDHGHTWLLALPGRSPTWLWVPHLAVGPASCCGPHLAVAPPGCGPYRILIIFWLGLEIG